MIQFDKRMAVEAMEDALVGTTTEFGCGVATGLCGAFHMCGIFSKEEWESFLSRIPARNSPAVSGGTIH